MNIFENIDIKPGYAVIYRIAMDHTHVAVIQELEANGFTVEHGDAPCEELQDTIVIRRINLANIDEKNYIYIKWDDIDYGYISEIINDFCNTALDIQDSRKGHLHFVREDMPRLKARFRSESGLLNRIHSFLIVDNDDDDDEGNQVSKADREDEIALQLTAKSSEDILDIISKLIKTYALKEHTIAPIKDLLEMTKSKIVIAQTTPSAIRVNKRLEVTLPDFDNLKLEFSPKMRVVYALFLRHPEGIFLKSIGSYKMEVIDLIKIVAPGAKNGLDVNSAKVMCDPSSNDLMQMISKINRIIKDKIHPMSGMDILYRITGERGEKYKIEMAELTTFA